MRAMHTRIIRLEGRVPKVMQAGPDAGQALAKLQAIVMAAGGKLDGESWAEALARVLGTTTGDLMAELRARAAACR